MVVFSELTQDQWQLLLNRLTIYAERKYTRLGWFSKGRYKSPSGQGPDDVAAEAITRLIEGRRNYDEQKHPDLLVYLRNVVDSIVSHVIESADFKRSKAMPYAVTEDGGVEEIELESGDAGPSHTYLQKDLHKTVNTILQEKFAVDKVVLGIIECMKAGIYKDAEIAECHDVEVKEVYNARKRLKREFDKIRIAS
jgi:hypothetical protein